MDCTYHEEPPRTKYFRFEPPRPSCKPPKILEKKIFFQKYCLWGFRGRWLWTSQCFSKILYNIKKVYNIQKLGSVEGRVSRSSYRSPVTRYHHVGSRSLWFVKETQTNNMNKINNNWYSIMAIFKLWRVFGSYASKFLKNIALFGTSAVYPTSKFFGKKSANFGNR